MQGLCAPLAWPASFLQVPFLHFQPTPSTHTSMSIHHRNLIVIMVCPLTCWLLHRAKAAKAVPDTVAPKDYSANRDWHNLRFEDGDTLIKLTHHPSGWLLLNSNILSQASPVLARSLSKEWARTKRIKKPAAGHEIDASVFSLVYDESFGTYFLQSEVFSTNFCLFILPD